ncbi:hypothetical protein F9C11_21855 [Amycolatopsis sp. VS8301801F10]|uniref:hypothetical protein n=1 Tax=Amycolatopsis sp. VS8301801F10 TaxID=2652442 RepID=UPI0038FCC207
MELEIYVHGRIDTMDATRVLTGLQHMADLISALGGGPVRFSRLQDGSIDTALRPMQHPKTTDAAFRQVLAGLRTAQEAPAIPAGWDDTALKAGQEATGLLCAFTDDGMDLTLRDGDTILDKLRVTTASRDHLKEAVAPRRASIGSVVGRLDSLSVHTRSEARLWPDRGGRAVVVRFADTQLDTVRSLIGCRVEARGKLVRDFRGRPVSLQLRAITRLATWEESPRLGSAAGVAPAAVTSRVQGQQEDVRGTA